VGAADLSWRDWEWDPAALAALVAAAALYHLHPRVRATPRHRLWFWGGVAAVAVAVFSPIDAGARSLLWLHMVQHLLLVLGAAPLWAASLPAPFLGWLTRRPGLGRLLWVLWNPWTATALFNAAVLAWHTPALYGWALRSEAAHAFQHVSFLGFGLVFWSVVLSPAPRNPPPAHRLVMVGASAVIQFLPAFALSLADRVLYTPYLEAPRLWGWSALDDQRWAGVLMWVSMNLAYGATAVWLGAAWLRSKDG
jgi:putative membrane protein